MVIIILKKKMMMMLMMMMMSMMSMMNMMIMMIRMMRMDFNAIGVETQRLFNSTLTRKTSMIETKGDTETALWQHSSFGVLSPAVICSVVIQ